MDPYEIHEMIENLKKEFEIEDSDKTKLFLGFHVEHLSKGIFVHKSSYIEKILKQFIIDKSYLVSTPMIVRSLEKKKNPFCPGKKEKNFLVPKYHILVSLVH